ncbi:MAG: hypothetical protein A2Z12_06700 [Actinobacteria bacterium RBG_16_68_21]|nr:MAG: hypothetical protein A2Z12_06700 [Actinobacteria bacterium RBG_16_68_21]
MPLPLAILPLKPFHRAKERLDIRPEIRAVLAREIATVVASACTGAGLQLAVVTGDDGVAAWATQRGVQVIVDPGGGLDAAVGAGVGAAGAAGLPWLVVHGDLPLLREEDLAGIPEAVAAGVTVLAPSCDGGTKLLGSTGPLALHYGPGSFVRHLAAAADRPRLVVVRTGTAVEVDTFADLHAAARLPGGAWLDRFLS